MMLMAIWVLEFSSGGYKIRKILHKNQHTQRKLLIGELSKIGHHFSNKFIQILALFGSSPLIQNPKFNNLWVC